MHTGILREREGKICFPGIFYPESLLTGIPLVPKEAFLSRSCLILAWACAQPRSRGLPVLGWPDGQEGSAPGLFFPTFADGQKPTGASRPSLSALTAPPSSITAQAYVPRSARALSTLYSNDHFHGCFSSTTNSCPSYCTFSSWHSAQPDGIRTHLC